MALQSHGPSSQNRIFERYLEVLAAGEPDRLDEVLTSDYVQVIPQSGEVVRGLETFKALLKSWPGGGIPGSAVEQAHIVGSETDYVVPRLGSMPFMSLVQVQSSGDTLSAYSRSTYPDGSVWYVASFATLRGGKIAKEVYFFAPLFDAPEWRLPYVHVIPREDKDQLDRVLAD